VSYYTFDQEIGLILTPIVALLDIKIFQIQRSVRKADIVLAESFAHVDDVLHFLVIQLIMN